MASSSHLLSESPSPSIKDGAYRLPASPESLDNISKPSTPFKSTGYEIVKRIDGQSEDYTLPSTAKTCPVKTCPKRSRKFSPKWRLMEHMNEETCHGWPRPHKARPEVKQDTALTDYTDTTPNVSIINRMSPTSEHFKSGAQTLADPHSATPLQSRSGRTRRPTTKSLQSGAGHTMLTSKPLDDLSHHHRKSTTPIPSPSSRHDTQTPDPTSMPPTSSRKSTTPKRTRPPADTGPQPDEPLLALLSEYTRDLERAQARLTSGASAQHAELSRVLTQCASLRSRGLVALHQHLPPADATALCGVYQSMAAHACKRHRVIDGHDDARDAKRPRLVLRL